MSKAIKLRQVMYIVLNSEFWRGKTLINYSSKSHGKANFKKFTVTLTFKWLWWKTDESVLLSLLVTNSVSQTLPFVQGIIAAV